MDLVTKFPKKLRELISRSLKSGLNSGKTHVKLVKDCVELKASLPGNRCALGSGWRTKVLGLSGQYHVTVTKGDHHDVPNLN